MAEDRRRFDTKTMERRLRDRVSASALLQHADPQGLPGYLDHLMGRRGISTDALAELSGLNRASLYKILNGSTRAPQRNVLLRLALTLRLSFDEAQQLLKYGGQASLSGQRGRDILISDGIIHQKSIDEVCARLREYRFPDLYGKG